MWLIVTVRSSKPFTPTEELVARVTIVAGAAAVVIRGHWNRTHEAEVMRRWGGRLLSSYEADVDGVKLAAVS